MISLILLIAFAVLASVIFWYGVWYDFVKKDDEDVKKVLERYSGRYR